MKRKSEAPSESHPRPVLEPRPSLADIEREVIAEAHEWGRQRLQERLQQLADEVGQVFPPGPTQTPPPDPAQ